MSDRITLRPLDQGRAAFLVLTPDDHAMRALGAAPAQLAGQDMLPRARAVCKVNFGMASPALFAKAVVANPRLKRDAVDARRDATRLAVHGAFCLLRRIPSARDVAAAAWRTAIPTRAQTLSRLFALDQIDLARRFAINMRRQPAIEPALRVLALVRGVMFPEVDRSCVEHKRDAERVDPLITRIKQPRAPGMLMRLRRRDTSDRSDAPAAACARAPYRRAPRYTPSDVIQKCQPGHRSPLRRHCASRVFA
ncbi:hypothetical protein SAMN05216551_10756 [Chitinasiproducens palmae]|uniref:Uncharacterized protein n=1 Tax=Chitinasiproducens palmae TaxID=1770053 RepID=A0A1H2PQM5_9BURK|nr:hypothetical protein SAMN05216551_10756 [Chitinasiproducens palmae]